MLWSRVHFVQVWVSVSRPKKVDLDNNTGDNTYLYASIDSVQPLAIRTAVDAVSVLPYTQSFVAVAWAGEGTDEVEVAPRWAI